MVLDESYQVNIGGGMRFLAAAAGAAAAFSISAFKREFFHTMTEETIMGPPPRRLRG